MTGPATLVEVIAARLSRARASGLLHSMLGLGGITAAEMALGLAGAVLLARELGVEGLGVYALAMAVGALAAIPVEFGLPALVTREIAHAGAGGGGAAEKGVLVFAAAVIAATSALLLMLVGALVVIFPAAPHNALPTLLMLVAGLIPLSAAGNLFGAALAGRQRVVLGAVPARIVRPAAFVAVLGALALAAPGWLNPVRAMLAQIGAAGLALAVGAGLFLWQFGPALRGNRAQVAWRRWSAAVLRLGLVSGISAVQPQILLLLTGALAGVEQVGLLRVAQRGANLVVAGALIPVSAAAPRVARLHSAGRQADLQELLTGVAQVAFAVSVAGLVAFLAVGSWLIIALFGAAFAPAWAALVVLTCATAVRMFFGPGPMLLNMLRREGTTVRGLAISLTLTTGVGALLAAPLGALGAALASLAGLAGMAGYLRRRACRELGLDPSVARGLVPFR